MRKLNWSITKRIMAMTLVAWFVAFIILVFINSTARAPQSIAVYRVDVSKQHVSGLFSHDEYSFTGYTSTNAYVSGILVGNKPNVTRQSEMTVYRQNNRYYTNRPSSIFRIQEWFK